MRIQEPLVSRQLKASGAELAMRTRQGRIMLGNPALLHGLIDKVQPVDDIEQLLGGGVTVTVVNAENEPMVALTAGYLSNIINRYQRLHVSKILGVGGEVGMGVNEISPVVALTSAIGIDNYYRDIQSTR